MAGGSFAIGAGNMYGFECMLRVAQFVAQTNGIGKIFFKRRCANTTEHGQFGKKIIDGLLVVHNLLQICNNNYPRSLKLNTNVPVCSSEFPLLSLRLRAFRRAISLML